MRTTAVRESVPPRWQETGDTSPRIVPGMTLGHSFASVGGLTKFLREDAFAYGRCVVGNQLSMPGADCTPGLRELAHEARLLIGRRRLTSVE